MSTTIDARTVRDAARRIASSVPGASRYVESFLAEVGADNITDDHTVTVQVTVPATSQDEANAAVEAQVAAVYLPSGWTASVAS